MLTNDNYKTLRKFFTIWWLRKHNLFNSVFTNLQKQQKSWGLKTEQDLVRVITHKHLRFTIKGFFKWEDTKEGFMFWFKTDCKCNEDWVRMVLQIHKHFKYIYSDYHYDKRK